MSRELLTKIAAFARENYPVQMRQLIAEIEVELEKPVPEPVAWLYDFIDGGEVLKDWTTIYKSELEMKVEKWGAHNIRPLYKAPPEVKESSIPVEATAWTGKGCGVISDRQKRSMLENAHLGGEFAGAAKTAERHDIPLGPLPLSQMELLTDDEIGDALNIDPMWLDKGFKHEIWDMREQVREIESAFLKKLRGEV